MAKTKGAQNMTVKFLPNDKGNPAGKLADAELHFSGGPLDGLKLIGFAIWERRGGARNVTFPARQYSINGERRSFALLRPAIDAAGQDRLRDVILAASSETCRALAMIGSMDFCSACMALPASRTALAAYTSTAIWTMAVVSVASAMIPRNAVWADIRRC